VRLLVVSGLSGSGKSTVLNVLEDLGFFCIDNLPIGMLPGFATHILDHESAIYQQTAIGIDARNHIEDLDKFPSILDEMREQGIKCEVIFLDADEHILIKRFSETRRKHPLSHENRTLAEAITLERQLLGPIADQAELYIETSSSNLHQLRDLIRNRVNAGNKQSISVMIQSFGFKHGSPADADLVFDVRCLPNPHWDTKLREYTGLEAPVIEFLESQPMVAEMRGDISQFINNWLPKFQQADRTYLTIAIGCTGGHHRSVYIAEQLGKEFCNNWDVIVRHRELV